MGDPFVVRAFARSFKHTVARWQGGQRESDEMKEHGMAKCALTGEMVDISLIVYADDLNKQIVETSKVIYGLMRSLRASSTD